MLLLDGKYFSVLTKVILFGRIRNICQISLTATPVLIFVHYIIIEPTNMLDLNAIIWLESYLQVC